MGFFLLPLTKGVAILVLVDYPFGEKEQIDVILVLDAVAILVLVDYPFGVESKMILIISGGSQSLF